MSTKLFVGNLPFQTTEEELEETFSRAGTVVSVALPVDRVTGRKRGFGFVEMQSEAEADAAIKGFHGQTLGGRQIVVNLSRSKSVATSQVDNDGSGNS
jgi:RNA recognition motif-containing protein